MSAPNDDEKQVFKKYPNARFIGNGSYGSVYHIKDAGVDLALKVLPLKSIWGSSNLNLSQDAVSECAVLSSSKHPNIVSFKRVELSPDSTDIWVIMELAFYNLKDHLKYCRNVWQESDPDTYIKSLIDICVQVLNGLNYLHSNDVMYLDLKPENCLVFKNKEIFVTKLADFGLSEDTDGGRNTVTIPGSLPYLAPELICGNYKYTTKTDMWSFGVMLTEIFFDFQHGLFHELIYKTRHQANNHHALFAAMIHMLGPPTSRWYNRFVNLMVRPGSCDLMGVTLTEIEKSTNPLKDSLFSTGVLNFGRKKKKEFVDYYGPQRFEQIINLIYGCLHYDPDQRFTATDILSQPLFQQNHSPPIELWSPPNLYSITIPSFLSDYIDRELNEGHDINDKKAIKNITSTIWKNISYFLGGINVQQKYPVFYRTIAFASLSLALRGLWFDSDRAKVTESWVKSITDYFNSTNKTDPSDLMNVIQQVKLHDRVRSKFYQLEILIAIKIQFLFFRVADESNNALNVSSINDHITQQMTSIFLETLPLVINGAKMNSQMYTPPYYSPIIQQSNESCIIA